MRFLLALRDNPFLLLALGAVLSASLTGGIVGSYVVVKRIVSLSGSIAHAVLGGMGFCLWLKRSFGIEWLLPLHGALLAGLLSAWLMGWIHLKSREREDTAIAAIWSIGMSIGILFTALTPGYNVELLNFLFGNILWTHPSDLALLLVLDVVTLVTVFWVYPRFLVLCFDEDQAYLRGYSIPLLYFLFLSLIAIAVVILIQVVGTILVITLFAIPPAIAGIWTYSLKKMMVLAILVNASLATLGLAISYELNWPPSATLSLTVAAAYLLSLFRVRASCACCEER